MKEIKIKQLLTQLAAAKRLGNKLTESKINELAKSISLLRSTTRDGIKSIISGGDIELKESVDFSDTNFYVDSIVDLVNNS